MTALFLQCFGLGDVIFSQGIAKHFLEQGYRIEWPVKPHFVEGLRRAYKHITFNPDTDYPQSLFMIKDKRIVDDKQIVPIRWADSIMKMDSKKWMRAKYDLYDLDYKKWKDSAGWNRDIEKEDRLFKMLGLDEYPEYNLVSTTFGSDFNHSVAIDSVEDNLPSIYMEQVHGYSLFDWAKVIQKATSIHFVNSASFYLLELLELNAKYIHLYQRTPLEKGFPHVDYLMTKNYILH